MTTVRPSARGPLLAALVLAGFPALAPAQPKYPPRPERVDVQIRYRIRADRDERVRQFRLLEANLTRLGFERLRQPDDDLDLDIIDPAAERFVGTVPSKNVLALLDDPRVRTILFQPTDFRLPEDAAKPVGLRIGIAGGFVPGEQQKLHGQIVAQLARLGFREAIGYDTTRYTLIRGDLPAGNVSRLLKDLRREPAGWFSADTPAADLPAPLRDVLPVRWVEVLPDAELVPLVPPPLPPNRERFTPGLRTVLDDQASLGKPIRVEAVYDHNLDTSELDDLRSRLRTTYARSVVNPANQQREQLSATLEGAAGNVVTVDFPQAAEVERFSAEPGVVFLRLPVPAVQTVNPTPAGARVPASTPDVLAATRLAEFQKLGYRGQGTKIVVIATEFPGLGSWLGIRFLGKDLPVPVAFIDLTAEFSRELLPAPAGTNGVGDGSAIARAAHLAAPDAQLVLVRVDPTAVFQVLTVARFVTGDASYSAAMQSRLGELSARGDDLRRRFAEAEAEYRQAFQNQSDEDRPRERRERAVAAFAAIRAEEQAYSAAVERALALQASMVLAGSTVVINPLVWEAGYPFDGLSVLSQVIDTSFARSAPADVAVVPKCDECGKKGDTFTAGGGGATRTRSATRPRPTPPPLWVQAASPSDGAVWAGPFLDANRDGAMEFAPATNPLPPGERTRELNYLGIRAADGQISRDLKAGTRVRLVVQWRETHDPTSYGGAESIFPLTLRVFKQLDPDAKARASDDLREVARSVGGPYRLWAEPAYGVYEQILEFAVPEDGRYAVRIDGREVYDPRLPALRRRIEITPRLVVDFLGGDGGRAVFASFSTPNAGVGIPGDARTAVTVAASDKPFGLQPAGLTGAGPGVTLLPKPDLVANGSIAVGGQPVGGSGVASGFAGGLLAALVASGAPPAEIIPAVGLSVGGPAVIPEGWLKVVPRK